MMEDHDFNREIVFAEIRAPKFAYAYKDMGRIHIGECEFCNQKNVLTVECECKRVRYCNESC